MGTLNNGDGFVEPDEWEKFFAVVIAVAFFLVYLPISIAGSNASDLALLYWADVVCARRIRRGPVFVK